jgi:hypothetical protein
MLSAWTDGEFCVQFASFCILNGILRHGEMRDRNQQDRKMGEWKMKGSFEAAKMSSICSPFPRPQKRQAFKTTYKLFQD